MEVMEPTAGGCGIITNSVIGAGTQARHGFTAIPPDKLNEDIVRLGEAKIQAMQESKEYRKGSLHLR